MDGIIDGIMSHGRGTLLPKFDVESAYSYVSVHSEKCYLLGMKWQGGASLGYSRKYPYHTMNSEGKGGRVWIFLESPIDLVLPFGLYLAAYNFSSIAYLLQWIMA